MTIDTETDDVGKKFLAFVDVVHRIQGLTYHRTMYNERDFMPITMWYIYDVGSCVKVTFKEPVVFDVEAGDDNTLVARNEKYDIVATGRTRAELEDDIHDGFYVSYDTYVLGNPGIVRNRVDKDGNKIDVAKNMKDLVEKAEEI